MKGVKAEGTWWGDCVLCKSAKVGEEMVGVSGIVVHVEDIKGFVYSVKCGNDVWCLCDAFTVEKLYGVSVFLIL